MYRPNAAAFLIAPFLGRTPRTVTRATDDTRPCLAVGEKCGLARLILLLKAKRPLAVPALAAADER
jgi:hypothetical protein